ncbi:MAG TPA: hypothetical protein VG456_07865 [Candidatus Sulfopaludibacter sp.]|jgi:hypothetical protein|nr:hypothetical protein [Candidatus Sulfopaludibacter sp.]
MWGALLFLAFFLMITPQTRKMVSGMLGHSGDWISAWAPFSYIILALLLVAGVFSMNLMVRWPKTPEPDNPLARYKHGNDVVD